MTLREIGHEADNLRAEIHCGRREGYEGEVRPVRDIVGHLGALQKLALERFENYLIFVVHQTTIAYIDEKGSAVTEPALMLSSDKSTWATLSGGEWKRQVEWYAQGLSEEFGQAKVHVTYGEVETKVLEQDR